MAHNLNKTNGRYAFAAFGQPAWHGIGQIVENVMTAEEAILHAGLDYTVEKRKLFIDKSANILPEYIEAGSYMATVRTDTNDVLGIVSPRYSIIQNRDVFQFFDPIIDRGEAIYHTAGALGKGETIFLSAKMPDDIVIRGEKIEMYVLLSNGHNGNQTMVAGLTPIRVVCQNTLHAALPGLKNRIAIVHRGDVHGTIADATKIMGMSSRYSASLANKFERMSSIRLNEKTYRQFILNTIKPKPEIITPEQYEETYSKRTLNLAEEIMQFGLTHDTQLTPATKGTIFGAYNAISGYFGWIKEYKSASDRMNDITFGAGAASISRAFGNATKLLNALS